MPSPATCTSEVAFSPAASTASAKKKKAREGHGTGPCHLTKHANELNRMPPTKPHAATKPNEYVRLLRRLFEKSWGKKSVLKKKACLQPPCSLQLQANPSAARSRAGPMNTAYMNLKKKMCADIYVLCMYVVMYM